MATKRGIIPAVALLTTSLFVAPLPIAQNDTQKVSIVLAAETTPTGVRSRTKSVKKRSVMNKTIRIVYPKKISPVASMAFAKNYMYVRYHWGYDQFKCLVPMWNNESNWNYNSANAEGAYGIPQAMPGRKMASAGSDWRTNPVTQIRWGLGYIKSTYGTPCKAWDFWQVHYWY